MRTLNVVIASLGLALAAPSTAAGWFTVTAGADNVMLPANDAFLSDLNALGLTANARGGATVTLNANRGLKFEYMGSESGFVNTFKVGSSSFAEFNKATWGPVPMFSKSAVAAGPITNWIFDSAGGVTNQGIGTAAFGIATPTLLSAGDTYMSNVLYLGFDDQIGGGDRDFDDFIVKVTAVPEPETWAMMIIGLGLVGAAHRRRRLTVSA
jgi:hypothetical protein